MKVLSVSAGWVRPWSVAGQCVVSAIGKTPVAGPVMVHQTGLEGDEHADAAHGGPGKAVYAYPAEHHAFWQTVRAQAKVAEWGAPVAPGLFGENLTLAGLLEDRAWVGDLLRFPHCALAVSEPRFPGRKLDAALGFKHAAKLMAESGYCGYYLGVREPGPICAGEPFVIVPGPREVSIAEIFRAKLGR